MTGPADLPPADQRSVDLVLADVQRQIDELSGQLVALTSVVHAHTFRQLETGERRRYSSGDGD